MKTKALFLIFLVSNIALTAQIDNNESRRKKEIDIHYNWVHIGQNISLNYNHYFQRHAVSVGVKKHFNQPGSDYQRYTYKNSGFAINQKESFGLNMGYKFDILKNRKIVTPYIFFRSELSYLRNKNIIQYIEMVNDFPTMSEITFISTPYFISENVIGVGMTTKVYKNWHLNQSVGFGVSTFRNKDVIYIPSRNLMYDPATLLRVGLTYEI
jgi:hypothetical protein